MVNKRTSFRGGTKVNIVLFLGAGFSRAFGLPIMDEFLAFADSSKKLDEDDKRIRKRFRKNILIISLFMDLSIYSNLKTSLT